MPFATRPNRTEQLEVEGGEAAGAGNAESDAATKALAKELCEIRVSMVSDASKVHTAYGEKHAREVGVHEDIVAA